MEAPRYSFSIERVLHEWSFRRVSYISYEMITSVRFCLSYEPIKYDFITFKTNNISIRKHIVDMDVVNDVTFSRQSVITRMVICFSFMTRRYPRRMIKSFYQGLGYSITRILQDAMSRIWTRKFDMKLTDPNVEITCRRLILQDAMSRIWTRKFDMKLTDPNVEITCRWLVIFFSKQQGSAAKVRNIRKFRHIIHSIVSEEMSNGFFFGFFFCF